MEKDSFSFAAEKADASSVVKNEYFDEQLQKIIREKACYLVKTGLWNTSQLDDLCQTLSLIVWNAQQKFDALRSNKYTFAKRVLFNRAKNLIDREARKKNGTPQEIVSLDFVVNDDGDTVADMIDADEYYSTVGNRCRSEYDTMMLRESVMYAMSLLPTKLQEVCREILTGETISSLAKKYKISRMGFYKKYLKPIREVFVFVGLDQF